ncbi:hypothetical protein GCM10007857_86390 [Bradyrhizobium iriomotense]|uniref:Uncharacterized protein n=1 Tax=Bradyrhizobium iriomotense TaxID=441950 RepID=A0ABQ6BEI0_9BRAD|nr:hypothetical protein GCM10007857_86390 [Bradyrhizobium iriomotense]
MCELPCPLSRRLLIRTNDIDPIGNLPIRPEQIGPVLFHPSDPRRSAYGRAMHRLRIGSYSFVIGKNMQPCPIIEEGLIALTPRLQGPNRGAKAGSWSSPLNVPSPIRKPQRAVFGTFQIGSNTISEYSLSSAPATGNGER